MKIATVALSIFAGVATLAFAAEPEHSNDYRTAIRDQLVLKVSVGHPDRGVAATMFSKPARVLVGAKRQQRLAVRCTWAEGPKGGSSLLLFERTTFVIDDGLVCEVSPTDVIDWIDGEPKIDKDQPNPLPDPTSPTVTPPAGAGVAPSVAADH